MAGAHTQPVLGSRDRSNICRRRKNNQHYGVGQVNDEQDDQVNGACDEDGAYNDVSGSDDGVCWG